MRPSGRLPGATALGHGAGMLDFFSDPATVYVVLGLAAVYLVARLVIGVRFRFGRGKRARLPDADATALLADTRALALSLEAAAVSARTLGDEAATQPDAPLDLARLDFDMPVRYRGDVRRLEKLPAPFGPLAALAARKAQTLRHRLHDPNWEPAQRRDGLDGPAISGKLAHDFEVAAAQARRVERLLREAVPSPTRRLKVVKH